MSKVRLATNILGFDTKRERKRFLKPTIHLMLMIHQWIVEVG